MSNRSLQSLGRINNLSRQNAAKTGKSMEETPQTARRPPGQGFPIITALAGAILLSALIYSIRNRTSADVIRYGGILALVFWLPTTITVAVGYWKDKSKRNLQLLLALPVISAALGATYYLLFAAVWDLLKWLINLWSSTVGGFIAVAACTLLIGTGLFLFRLKYRFLYGMSEAAVGVIVASYRFSPTDPLRTLTDPNFYFAFLVSGVYLVVRGLDNMHQGTMKEPIDPVAEKLFHWYKSPNRRKSAQQALINSMLRRK